MSSLFAIASEGEALIERENATYLTEGFFYKSFVCGQDIGQPKTNAHAIATLQAFLEKSSNVSMWQSRTLISYSVRGVPHSVKSPDGFEILKLKDSKG